MSLYNEFRSGLIPLEQLIQDAKAKVRWAAEPVLPGDSIGRQILNAARELRLDDKFTRRMWYGVVGPETWVNLHNAWLGLVERRHTSMLRGPSPWAASLVDTKPTSQA